MTSIDSVKELVALDDAANVSACLNETQAIAEISYEEAMTSITAVCAGEMLIGVQANRDFEVFRVTSQDTNNA